MRRHTANRDRHVLRVGLHRRSHQRGRNADDDGALSTTAPGTALPHHRTGYERGRRRRWWMRVPVAGCGSGASVSSAAPPPPIENFPCMRAGAVLLLPFRLSAARIRHSVRSSQLRASRRQACTQPFLSPSLSRSLALVLLRLSIRASTRLEREQRKSARVTRAQ